MYTFAMASYIVVRHTLNNNKAPICYTETFMSNMEAHTHTHTQILTKETDDDDDSFDI